MNILASKKCLPLKCNYKLQLAGYCHMAAIQQAVYLLLPFSFQKSIPCVQLQKGLTSTPVISSNLLQKSLTIFSVKMYVFNYK